MVIATISPLGTALALALIALLVSVSGRHRIGLILGFCATAWLLAWSLPVISTTLTARLEQEFPPMHIDQMPTVDAIIVLGGGVFATGIDSHPVDLGRASDRVWYGARLYHANKAPLVILSGGAKPGVMPEAEAMAVFMLDFGVPENAIILENNSRNSRQNAINTAQLLAGSTARRILLVTSAMHMGRALQHFKDAGLDAIPAPTDYESAASGYTSPWIPETAALDASARAIKELVGQLVWR
jgi:uncharacterized SAM-binding protein YcdF (DUF218 family)